MLFSSITFLYYFLPCVLIVYFAVPVRMKNVVLFLFSLLFYGWGEPRILFVMLATIFISYVLGILTEKYANHKRIFLTLAIALSIGSLSYFKYADFFVTNVNQLTGLSLPLLKVSLPIGISFYTFQVLSYNIDVYRGTVGAQKNPLYLATYISMFPQLIAGPIVRYQDVEKQLMHRVHTIEKAAYGIRRFAIGLGKKVLLANALGELCTIFRDSNEKSIVFHWMYALAFMLQIYFDFSGYSDMAIGLGKILGFDFLENFNYPYIAKSITEFWRRWHISLGSWFRDYVYIPLGGSRCGKVRTYVNIFTVWMLTGLWHGAAWNFVVWGLFFAVLLVLEKNFFLKQLEKAKVWNHLYVVLAVGISFVIFNASSMGQAMQDIGGMFGAQGIPFFTDETMYYLKSYALVLLASIVGATPFAKNIALKAGKIAECLEPVMIIGLLVLCTAYLVDGSFNPFLYFRF